MPHLRFFFEAGVPHTPLWPGPPDAPDLDSPYGSPCELERLPISAQTRTELAGLCAWYQSSIDWEYPPDPSPWPAEEWRLFRRRAETAYTALCRELGDGWQVEMTHKVWTG
ncbi:hypothetical protein OG304_29965 [Streptomyces sp. NBC_00160]|uniref:hypothetical protein n=1 Tax=Streptomyces TaxID=1883 RepID=UPI00207A7DE7|nr:MULTISPECIES: hypothetical protein [Streptomyces]MCM9077878.1 hypothetical protein [Streptomyces spororaveus]MCX5307643.1 hypothetical protein [Streptomyces sp. NBC_00160]